MPSLFKRLRRCVRDLKTAPQYAALSAQEAFDKIYSESRWGSNDKFRFFSGQGSHDDRIITPYICAVTLFVTGRADLKTSVDLGCGDFNVGRHICPLFEHTTAIDVSPQVIDQNRNTYCERNVSFLQADILKDELPDADVYFVRQVLQYLSNRDILMFLNNSAGKCRYLIITETLCESRRFMPNRDIVTGPNVRFNKRSGVILTAPPFNIDVAKEEKLCEVKNGREFIRTTAYTLTPSVLKRNSGAGGHRSGAAGRSG